MNTLEKIALAGLILAGGGTVYWYYRVGQYYIKLSTSNTEITCTRDPNAPEYYEVPKVTLTATTNDPNLSVIYFWVKNPDGGLLLIGDSSVSQGSASITFNFPTSGTYIFFATSDINAYKLFSIRSNAIAITASGCPS